MTDARRRHRAGGPQVVRRFDVTPHPPQQGKEVSAMVLIVCIITGIATAALMSWLQPALERWAVRHPPG